MEATPSPGLMAPRSGLAPGEPGGSQITPNAPGWGRQGRPKEEQDKDKDKVIY